MRNIILIGMRCSGKTSVAKVLEKKTGMKLISIDSIIEKKHGPIDHLVKNVKNGWNEFRKIEKKILREIPLSNAIIDCGGGIIEDKDNLRFLRNSGTIVWLKSDENQIISRIKKSKRPSLTKKGKIIEVNGILKIREPIYRSISDIIINTNKVNKNKTINKITIEILQKIKSKICVSIRSKNVASFVSDFRKAEKVANLVEIRVDDLTIKQIRNLLSQIKDRNCEIIVTSRNNNCINVSKLAISLGVEFVDIDLELLENQLDIDKKKLIISSHDSDENLELIYERIIKHKPAIIKIVKTAKVLDDNLEIFKLLKRKEKFSNLTAFCMGKKGQFSRILGPKFGSIISYWSLNTKTATGQMNIDEMKMYHVRNISKDTKVLGVIGSHANKSDSMKIHNRWIREKDADCVYVPIIADEEELKKAINIPGLIGASITIPYKETVLKLLKPDKKSKVIGAANTIIGKTCTNTDDIGAIKALKEVTTISKKKVLVIGAGGASRAIIHGLKKNGAIVTVINRTKQRADIIAKEMKIKSDDFNKINELIDRSNIVINATNVGGFDSINNSIVPKLRKINNKINNKLKQKFLMDIIYKPKETKLIKMAKKAGYRVVYGERMLYFQALEQFKLWRI